MTRPAWVQLLHWITLVTVVTFVVVMTGGTLVWLAERDVPASNLKHWGDCLWWSVTTLSTVGYGEHFPVTVPGRLIAVFVMASGVAIIGAVAAVVAFAFASQLTTRLEAAVQHMESQVEHVEHEMESVHERVGDTPGGRAPVSGLRELVIGVGDSETAASLTWLLARLGWHPEAGDTGVAWRDGGVVLRVAVRPWDQPFGVQGRLTFGAGSPERLARISREATRHGFHRMVPRSSDRGGVVASGIASGIPSGIPVPMPAPAPASAPCPPAGTGTAVATGDGSVRAPVRADRRSPSRAADHGPEMVSQPDVAADGQPVTLRAVSGFEVVLVTS
jgi:hypothetical protein